MQALYIVSRMPENVRDLDYYEPFFGAGNILYQKPPSFRETATELAEPIANIHQCLKDPVLRAEMLGCLRLLPGGSKPVYEWIVDIYRSPEAWMALPRAQRAAFFLFCLWNGFNGAFPSRKTGLRKYLGAVRSVSTRNRFWLSVRPRDRELEALGNRLEHVDVICGDAFIEGKLEERLADPNALVFADPPYNSAAPIYLAGRNPDSTWFSSLFELFRGAEARLMITIDFSEPIRPLCSPDWNVTHLKTVYRSATTTRHVSDEVLITNFPRSEELGAQATLAAFI
jgi:site-specific DNA-adenine methylase